MFNSDEQDQREQEERDGYKSESYDGSSCNNCGRQRVMLCRNGKRVCEKCGWDQDKNVYSNYLTM
jgi:ribosomal protein L37AE/L43A